MDLFTPLIEESKFHSNYRSILKSVKKPERDELSRWAEGFPDRDGKFVKQFQETFNSSFWEIYLHAVMKEYGFALNWKHNSPDFNIKTSKQQFTIEATTANTADGKENEWERMLTLEELNNISFNKMNMESIIRLSNALISKYRLYKAKYSKLDHVKKKPFVVAIAPFEQPGFNLQYNRPIMALLYDYYVDEDAYTKAPELYPDGPPDRQLGYVEKDNGAEIPLGVFLDDQMSEISAVIFSCTATWGKVNVLANNENVETEVFSLWATEPHGRPEKRFCSRKEYTESITDGLQVFHNPYAKYPLAPETFKREGVVQCFPDVGKGIFYEEEATKCLHFRQVINHLK